MKVASWNVNSIRMRLGALLDWLRAEEPDVCCLQETKVPDEAFPSAEILSAGYASVCQGQKSYNGVAILCRKDHPLTLLHRCLPGDGDDAPRRLVAARVGPISVVDVYVPNGQAVGSDKYAYKLGWLERLKGYLAQAFTPSERLVVCGDFNVALEDRDVHAPEQLRGSVMFSDPEKAMVRAIMAWGLEDSLRLLHPEGGLYSWWDYRGGAVRRNEGWRIDLILCSAPLASKCRDAGIDGFQRKLPQASDHAPIHAVFDT